MSNSGSKPKRGASTATLEKEVTEKPPMYKVLFHNDDYTTMEFVVEVLIGIFRHNEASAFKVMMHVHHSGTGVAGIYTREVAETKAALTIQKARSQGFPLEVTTEPA